MSIVDPNLDAGSPVSGFARPEGREVAMLRHDLRGALQGVVGGIGQIRVADLPDDLREQVERAAAAAKSLIGLVGALLGDADLARPDGEIVEVAPFLEHLRRRYGGEARQRGLALEVTTEGAVPAGLRLDPTSLARVVENLVGNAVKFARAGTVRLALTREAGGAVSFRVLDEGPGLSSAALEGAFQFGVRPSGSSAPGQGLGLHIVRSLVDRLGGEVSLANRPGGGVEAVVRFPAEVAIGAAPEPEARAQDLAGVRILLAEDNLTNQMVASQMLRALKAEVTICADGVEALERFEAAAVDLVVVDIEMPRLSGLDVIRAIRARGDDRAHVPIVALTAYAMREHRERIAAAGANGLIAKPITSVEALGRGLASHVAACRPPVSSDPEDGAAEVAATLPVVELAIFDALCETIGRETMDDLLDKVVADLTSAQRELAAAVEGPDCAAIRSASHILISVAGALGAVRLEAGARSLNTIAHTEMTDRIKAKARRCIDEIDAAVAFARARRTAG